MSAFEDKAKIRNSRFARIIFVAFIVAEAAIYAAFMSIDILGDKSTVPLKYSAVALCFLFSLTWSAASIKDNALVSLGFAFTLVADIFLLVIDDYYLLGVCAFFFAQCCYFARIKQWTLKNSRCHPKLFAAQIIVAFLRGAVPVVVCIILYINSLGMPILYCAVFYFSFLIFNAVQAFMAISYERRALIFAVALVLFAFCDVCVGLVNAADYVSSYFSEKLLAFANVAMWGFYAPSQALIAISAFPYKDAEFAFPILVKAIRKCR